MRFNIRRLEAAGFKVYVDGEVIDIHSPPMSEEAYAHIKSVVVSQARITDPGLQDYAIGAFLIALQRAQILELGE